MMQGFYGEPLEVLKRILEQTPAFAEFSPTVSVHLYERGGRDTAVGDGWAVLGYREGGHVVQLMPGFGVDRTPELTLVKAVSAFTEEAKEELINRVGAVVAGIVDHEDAQGVISEIRLAQFALDEDTDPPTLGAVLRVRMDIG